VEQPYPVIATRIDPRSPDYRANHDANTAAVDKLSRALHDATIGGGEKYTSRHKAAGKLLPRERIELLLDRDAYFLELCPLAGKDVPGHTTGAGFIGGIGRVSGVEVVISANDSTVKGGAISEITAWKSGRLNDIAEQNRLPTISLIESAGADLPNQSKIFVPGGRGFRDLTRRSRMGIPSICLVFGSSTAGGAYIPGMTT
jgi:acyl-CoA carboxylase subunit beta